jgi:hypothetical protein
MTLAGTASGSVRFRRPRGTGHGDPRYRKTGLVAPNAQMAGVAGL